MTKQIPESSTFFSREKSSEWKADSTVKCEGINDASRKEEVIAWKPVSEEFATSSHV